LAFPRIRLDLTRWQASGRQFLAYSRFLLPASVLLVFLTVLAVGWFTQPDSYVRGYAPEQPIPYSHRLHAGTLRIPCQYCHSGAVQSRQAGIPSVQKCMNCHGLTKTDSPHIRKLASLIASGEPMKWKRVHNLPDYSYFDHRPHVTAGILCQTCHGEIQTMEVVSQHMSMRMANCLGCHREPKDALPADSGIERGAEHCNACHR
jgi:hypothetical protein